MPEKRPPRRKLSYIFYYLITTALCVMGVVGYCLLYQGSGAMLLLQGETTLPAAALASPTGGQAAIGAAPTPESPLALAAPTPAPTPAPSAEGRLIPFQYNQLWGYKNLRGEQVIEPKYLRALEFSRGPYAFAATEWSGKLLYGLISRSGLWALEPAWGNVRPYSEGFAAVEIDGKWGFIDETGKLVINAEYREVGDFHNGRAAVRPASTFGYIDPDGDMAIKEAFDKAGDFSDDMAFVEQDGKSYLIDKIGRKLVTWDHDEVGERYAGGYAVIQIGNSYSYYDVGRHRRYKGFEGARPFSEGYAAVKKDGKWGFIDNKGIMVIPAQFDEAGDFSQDRAAVRDSSGKWGFIDKGGVTQVPCVYDEVEPFVLDAAIVRISGVTGLVNRQGDFTELQ